VLLRAAAVIALMAAARPALALELQPDVGVQWHELRERDAGGRELVREQGWSPRVGLALSQQWSNTWTLRAAGTASSGRAAYDGRTQSGTPIGSRTDTQSVAIEAGLQWQPVASSTARLEAGWQIERFRRHIESAGGYSGLDERLTQPRWSFGASWSTAHDTRLRAVLLWGDRAPLSVRFDGGLYDESRLSSGRATGVAVDASWALMRHWRIGASAETIRIGRSLDAPLTLDGATVGSVAQPSWRRDRVSLLLQREFAD